MWYALGMKDEVNWLDEKWVGQLVRLEIPLKSVSNLRRVAEVLRGLAYQLDNLGRFGGQDAVGDMLEVKKIVRRANKDLTKIRGRGRPKKGRNSF